MHLVNANVHVLAAGWAGIDANELKTVVAAFIVGIVVGITGMGGGALMTPALIFLGVGNASAVVTADLTSSAVSQATGATVHYRQGSPHLRLAMWLIIGSVPMAFLGPRLLAWLAPGDNVNELLKVCIGFALLFAATTYAIRLYVQLQQTAAGKRPVEADPVVRPVPTLLVGMLGGLLVGITSVGAGSVIMIAMLILYPTLGAVRLVGTTLVQAVPLVITAAVSNILTHGLDLRIAIPLVIGAMPGTFLGSKVAPKVPVSLVRRGIVVVLTISGLTLLDDSSWNPLNHGTDQTHPLVIALLAVGLVTLLPLVWGLLRRRVGLPMFGKAAAVRAHDRPANVDARP